MTNLKKNASIADFKSLSAIARIEPATLADVAPMVRLLTELFAIEIDFSPNEQRQTAGLTLMLADTKNRHILVARINDQVVGMATAQLVVSTAEGGLSAWVEDVIVDRNFRRIGIGSALLLGIKTWAIEAGAQRMQLLTESVNEHAKSFYLDNKWGVTDLVCMRTILNPPAG
jgi:GNAT superfamily N-acetyltransferase